MKVEAVEVKNVDGKPSVVLTPGSSVIEVNGSPAGGRTIPLELVPVGSVLKVVYAGKTRFYRVIGVGNGVVFLERIKKADYEASLGRVGGELEGAVRVLGLMAIGRGKKLVKELEKIDGEIKRQKELINELKRKMNEFERVKNLRLQIASSFDPTPLVAKLKEVVKAVGSCNGRRCEINFSGRDKDGTPFSLKIVLDEGKNMFYVKLGRGFFSDYLYFEKGKDRKVNNDLDGWTETIELLSEYLRLNKDAGSKVKELVKHLDEAVRQMTGSRKEIESVVRGLIKAVKTVSAGRRKVTFSLETARNILMSGFVDRSVASKILKEMSQRVKRQSFTVTFSFTDGGGLKYINVNGLYFKEPYIPPELLSDVLNTVFYSLLAEALAGEVVVKNAERILGEVKKLVEAYDREYKKALETLRGIVETAMPVVPKKERSYGYLLKIGDLEVGYDVKKRTVLFVRAGNSYIYSEDGLSLRGLLHVIGVLKTELERAGVKT